MLFHIDDFLQVYQQEIAGETDEEVEKYKCKLIEEMPLTESQLDAIEAFKPPPPVESTEPVEETKEEESDKVNLLNYFCSEFVRSLFRVINV